MAQALPRLHHPRPSPADVRLHADDHPHHRLDVLAWATLVVGAGSFLIAALGGSLFGVALGLVGFVMAMVAQMFSATTAERWLILPGWGLAFIGGLMNLFFLYS